MVNICLICMACDSLEPLSDEHRGVLEPLVSTAVNLNDLRDLKLLVCSACVSLIKALAQFRNTAIAGVKHFLLLSQKKQYEPEEVLIKEEPPDKDSSVGTVFEIEIEQECVNNLQDAIKSEESDMNWENIEDVIPKNTTQLSDNTREAVKTQDSREVPLISPSDNTAVFTHSKVVQSNDKTQKPTTSIAAFPNIQLVPQKQAITAQCPPPLQFFNPAQFVPTNYYTLNMPTYLPLQMENVVKVVMPLQNITSKPEAPKNKVPSPAATKPLEERKPEPISDNINPQTSARKPVILEERVTVKPTLKKRALKPKAAKNIVPSPTAPKPLEETNPELGSNNNNPKAPEVIVKWCSRGFTRHQMFMQRAKERSRPEFVDAPYKCKTCILMFRSQEEMEAHAKEHEFASDQLPCKACAMPVRPSDEEAHMAKHARRLQCARCAFSTEQLSVIEAHDCSSQPARRIRYHRKLNPFKCELCNTRYSDMGGLMAHKERRHKHPEVYKCDICSKEFPGTVQRSMHIRNNHKPKDNILDAFRPELYCAECNKSFTTASQYRIHRMTRKHCPKDNWNYECDMCGKKFLNRGDIIYHIRWKHNEGLQKAYVCPECGRCTRSPFRLRLHMQSHKPLQERPRPHVCHLCGKAFMVKKNLEEHVLSHSGLRPLTCPLCPATFTYSAALFIHNQIKHLNIKRNSKKTKDDKVQKRKKDKGKVGRKKDVSEANT